MADMFLTIVRVLVGILVMTTGVRLVQGDYSLAGFAEYEPFLTGLFIILMGVHIIFSSIFR